MEALTFPCLHFAQTPPGTKPETTRAPRRASQARGNGPRHNSDEHSTRSRVRGVYPPGKIPPQAYLCLLQPPLLVRSSRAQSPK